MFSTILLFGVLTGIFLGIGYLLGGVFGMGLALALAIILNFGTYWYSDRIVLGIYRAKPSQDAKLNEMVEKLSREARIPKPRVYVVPSNAPNAFATGRDLNHSALAVTEGMKGLTDAGMEGGLSHEMGRHEHKADRYGALPTKNPEGLASALIKISETAKRTPMTGSSATSHLWIVNPFQGSWFTNMFSTHPPMEQRIRRLRAMEG